MNIAWQIFWAIYIIIGIIVGFAAMGFILNEKPEWTKGFANIISNIAFFLVIVISWPAWLGHALAKRI